MSLVSLSKQTGTKPSDAKTIHQRPALIQELEWQPPYAFAGSSLQTDSAREILFTFYNGELFRIAIGYQRSKTEGLTEEDMIEAISAKYGTATRSEASVISVPSSGFDHTEKVIASWEDARYSYSLFRPPYQPTFGILVLSKRLETLARASAVESIRLNEEQAPQRELERQEKQDEADRVALRKARLANKATFRP